MTFAGLVSVVTRITGVVGYDVTSLLREAENEFIERTHCLWKHDLVSTEDLNGGTLSDTYDLPTGFVGDDFIKIEWEGNKLWSAHQKSGVEIYLSSGELNTGTPEQYQIEVSVYRLIPKPSSHGYMGRWYHYYNTSTTTSPIIPTAEHRKLADYVIYTIFEMLANDLIEKGEKEKAAIYANKAIIYENKWESAIQLATEKYNIMKSNQKVIEDVLGRAEEELFFNVDNLEGYFPE